MGTPLDAAVAALARRDLTEHELLGRLARLGVPESEQATLIGRLRAAGYVDDARVAAGRAGRLAERGYGDAFIRADLDNRGVATETVSTALSALEPEGTRATRLAAGLGGGPRAARTLARKGFATDSIERVLASLAEEM